VLQNHEENKFNQLPKAQQDAAVGAAVRFILFKGTGREATVDWTLLSRCVGQ
jgi:hypothetical protein